MIAPGVPREEIVRQQRYIEEVDFHCHMYLFAFVLSLSWVILYSSHTPRSSWAGVMGITIIQDNTYDSTLANLISNTTATTNTFPHTLARCLPGRTASSPGWVRF